MSKYLPYAALLITLALVGVFSFLPVHSMWGLNHLQYLPNEFLYVFVAVAAIVMGLGFVGRDEPGGQTLVVRISSHIFERPLLAGVLFAIGCVVLFMILRVQTFFMGDGYILLSTFGQGSKYIVKWTEPGGSLIVRGVQLLFTDTTKAGALSAFQGISWVAGVITVANVFVICRHLTSNPSARLVSLISLLASGSLLLFFGYVEIYPMVWAAATTFFALSLRYLSRRTGLVWVILSYCIVVFIHLETICFAPAFAYLVYLKVIGRDASGGLSWRYRGIVVALTAAGCIGLVLVSRGHLFLEQAFLPFFSGRPGAEDYFAFSAKHALDIANLAFIVSPGLLFLLIGATRRSTAPADAREHLLFHASVGALAFIGIVDPAFGMARDWDLMAVCVLPLLLWLLDRVARTVDRYSFPEIAGYALTTVTITCAFIAVNTRVSASEERMHNLLRYYGAKNNSGWVVLSNYYHDRGDINKERSVSQEMAQLFPDDGKLVQAWSSLSEGDYSRAIDLGRQLYEVNPNRSDYILVLSKALTEAGQAEEALNMFERAEQLRPYWTAIKVDYGQALLKVGRVEEALAKFREARSQAPELTVVLESIALAQLRLGFLDSANACADSLFAENSNHPGAHLIRVVTALASGDTSAARYNYGQYLLFGEERSDFRRIRDYYGFLTGK